MEMGLVKTNGSPRSRARAYDAFYDPAIEDDADAATDSALKETGGSAKYRGVKRSVDIPAAPPKDIPHVRRVRARAGLRRRFTPPYEAYHRELEAAKRRNRQ